MSEQTLTLRPAQREDVGTILELIGLLAEYEHMTDQVVATEALLAETLFDKRQAEVLLAELGGQSVGMALFFHNYSTFLGRGGLYLEDLFVRPEYRGRGFGKQILQRLAQIAVERGCGRMEWSCLDWNTPSIGFYRSLGAQPMDEWTVYRLTGDTLAAAAAGNAGRKAGDGTC